MKSRRFRQAVAISLAAVMSVSVISFTGGGRRADADGVLHRPDGT